MKKIQNIQGLLIDLDGTIYQGSVLLPGAKEFIDWVNDSHLRYIFVTNNSTKTPKKIVKKLSSLGIRVEEDKIVTSAIVTASYLAELPEYIIAYAICEEGLLSALKEKGIEVSETNPNYVVLGLDTNFTFEKLEKAIYAIHAGARYILCNPDKVIPEADGFAPDAGSLSAAIESATNIKPTVIGKPSPHIFRFAAKKMEIPLSNLIMIGDSIETDIKGARNLGIKTCLVQTGIPNENKLEDSSTPDIIIQQIMDFPKMIRI